MSTAKFLSLHASLERCWEEAEELFIDQIELKKLINENKQKEKELLQLIREEIKN